MTEKNSSVIVGKPDPIVCDRCLYGKPYPAIQITAEDYRVMCLCPDCVYEMFDWLSRASKVIKVD